VVIDRTQAPWHLHLFCLSAPPGSFRTLPPGAHSPWRRDLRRWTLEGSWRTVSLYLSGAGTHASSTPSRTPGRTSPSCGFPSARAAPRRASVAPPSRVERSPGPIAGRASSTSAASSVCTLKIASQAALSSSRTVDRMRMNPRRLARHPRDRHTPAAVVLRFFGCQPSFGVTCKSPRRSSTLSASLSSR
jgi:hypothetical protein